MKKAQFTSLIRSALVIGGTVAVMSGKATGAEVEAVSGAALTLAGLVWSQVSAFRKAKAIDTIGAMAQDENAYPASVVEAVKAGKRIIG